MTTGVELEIHNQLLLKLIPSQLADSVLTKPEPNKNYVRNLPKHHFACFRKMLVSSTHNYKTGRIFLNVPYLFLSFSISCPIESENSIKVKVFLLQYH